MNGSEIVESAFQWCLVELDAKVQVEHSKKWANRLQKVKENCAIVKSLGYEALRQWEDLIMPSFIDGMWYPEEFEEGFNKEKYLESRIYGESLKYVIDMMRDFIENTKFNKELADCDGEFIYNNTPLQY